MTAITPQSSNTNQKSDKENIIAIFSQFPLSGHRPEVRKTIVRLSSLGKIVYFHIPGISLKKALLKRTLAKTLPMINGAQGNILTIPLIHPLPFIRFKAIYALNEWLMWKTAYSVLTTYRFFYPHGKMIAWFFQPDLNKARTFFPLSFKNNVIILDTLDILVKNSLFKPKNIHTHYDYFCAHFEYYYNYKYKFTGTAYQDDRSQHRARIIEWGKTLKHRLENTASFILSV